MQNQEFVRYVRLHQSVIFLVWGFAAGFVPIFGPVLLGAVLVSVARQMKPVVEVARISLSLWVVCAGIATYASSYLISNNSFAIGHVLIFLLSCGVTWGYQRFRSRAKPS